MNKILRPILNQAKLQITNSIFYFHITYVNLHEKKHNFNLQTDRYSKPNQNKPKFCHVKTNKNQKQERQFKKQNKSKQKKQQNTLTTNKKNKINGFDHSVLYILNADKMKHKQRRRKKKAKQTILQNNITIK